MIVALVKNKSLTSIIIRLFTWSKWHHAAALTADGKYVIEALGATGVTKTPIEVFKKRYTNMFFCEITCDDKHAQEFLNKQLGKKYDWLAIFSLVFRRKWQKEDRWFCFELIAAASGVFREDSKSRITGHDLYSISKDVDIGKI